MTRSPKGLEDPTDDPEVAMQKTDRAAVLQSCLKQLSSAHRQVIDLVYHEQSIEEIARIIGVPQNTVKTRVFHARKRIAELMATRGIERAALITSIPRNPVFGDWAGFIEKQVQQSHAGTVQITFIGD